jgi:RNA polymerase sigma-70 factor (ECF subfamily)
MSERAERSSELHARGRAAWPTVDVSADELVAAVDAYNAAAGTTDDAVDVAEIYVACACQRGDSTALAAFRAMYFTPLARTLGTLHVDAAGLDDLWQTLAIRLFVDGETPKIASYAGRGQLHGLVKVAATRLALDLRERDERSTSDAILESVPSGRASPELQWMKVQHGEQLKEELERAIGALEPRERALLRLSLVERVGIDAIATAYGAHRATVARWLATARERLTNTVRERLSERWQVEGDELGELRALIESHVDLSLERLLAR